MLTLEELCESSGDERSRPGAAPCKGSHKAAQGETQAPTSLTIDVSSTIRLRGILSDYGDVYFWDIGTRAKQGDPWRVELCDLSDDEVSECLIDQGNFYRKS